MGTLRTRINGWPLVTVKDEFPYSIAFFDGDVPEILSTIWVGRHEVIPDEAVSATQHWRDEWSGEMLDHLAAHLDRGEGDGCDDCNRIADAIRSPNPDSKPQPLPSIHAEQPQAVAVWHKGHRVREMKDYVSYKNVKTGEIETYCHVEAFSTTGEILCATARLDEITYSAYRPTVREP